MRVFFLCFVLLQSLYAKENLSSLLASYEHEAELSKITKKEEAGVINIYTRHDLEKMQVKTLDDVLRILPGFHLTRTSNNLTSLQKPTLPSVQLTSIRLYINDHDMSSSSFGSASLIWGELPLEYIDHIEIYKGASSLEFGNETGSIIMKLYTKTAAREEGGKVRVYGDNYGTINNDLYVASTKNAISYFAYANLNNVNRKKYYNSYENKNYEFDGDRSGHNLYANLQYKKWILELGTYAKKSANFIGSLQSLHQTPEGGNFDTYYNYINLTKKFQNNIKIQISYDNESYTRDYVDPNGIILPNKVVIQNSNIHFKDEIYSAIIDKKIKFNKHSLLLGSFYKRKKFNANGDFYNNATNYNQPTEYANSLDLYSIYAEYTYDYDTTTRLIASLKEDIFRYDKVVPSNSELAAKVGLIKYINNFQIKAFLTSSYISTAFYQLYNPYNIPYTTNPDLKNMHLYLATLSVKYKKNKHRIKFVAAKNQINDLIIYTSTGLTNSSTSRKYIRLEAKYSYIFNLNNKFSWDIFYGKNSQNLVLSPKYGSIVQLFSKYKKFDIYNELVYKSAYDYFGLSMEASLNYTASVKYHYCKDLSVGLRGENIFDTGYKQAYKGVDYAIPVTDQKIWFNLEYLF